MSENANPFQRIVLTRPPERNSEGTRFDVWMRTDDGVKFLGTGEIAEVSALSSCERAAPTIARVPERDVEIAELGFAADCAKERLSSPVETAPEKAKP